MARCPTVAWLEPERVRAGRGAAHSDAGRRGRLRLSGVKRHVPYRAARSSLLVLARDAAAMRGVFLLVDPAADGVTLSSS